MVDQPPSSRPGPPPSPEGIATLPHTRAEDVFGVVCGTFVVALGITLLTTVGAVTGGTAGLALLLGYALGLPFGPTYVVVTSPFLVLAWRRKGRSFTLRTAVSVVLVGAFSALHESVMGLVLVPWHAILTGNLAVGIGLLIIFRHNASLGGFNVLALIAQEELGWRAGYVQMALDVSVVMLAFALAPASVVLLSAAGAVVLNLVLAVNHRPGRYRGA